MSDRCANVVHEVSGNLETTPAPAEPGMARRLCGEGRVSGCSPYLSNGQLLEAWWA